MYKMLYPHNLTEKLQDELFRQPGSEYRGTPFWAWNGKLDDKELARQIDMFEKMGMGGFHIHVRTGMDAPYLDEAFMGHVRFCLEQAKKRQMLTWLYDEDRWPSGTAGGKVTSENPEYAMKYLLFTPTPYGSGKAPDLSQPHPGWGQISMRRENGRLLAAYKVSIDKNGTLAEYERIEATHSTDEENIWYAYAEHTSDDPWFNNHPYIDTLQKEAVDKFIRITHETYRKEFGDEFGRMIPAIFTDEPKVAPKKPLTYANKQQDVFLPWTTILPDDFQKKTGYSILDKLPELIWDLPEEKISRVRYDFHNWIADRFASVYCGQIGSWCEAHNIMSTGHLYGEPTLLSQTNAVGDAMRCYPSFGLPGIDMLCDSHEYNTVKQAQSIVRQNGKEGMLSELYGVTGWDFDFRGHKLQGDWQAALGVTVRVPHLTWMTMKGEAKRDYPASIGYQSPWWSQYSLIENHFSRLATALSRGRAAVRIAVIHPIESYWLYWGPMEQTAAKRDKMEKQFSQLTEWLLFGSIDFDFISEACLPEQCHQASAPLQVGEMQYDVVILSGLKTLRSSTLSRLTEFARQGGKLIFVGDCPDCIDSKPSEAIKPLIEMGTKISYDKNALLEALLPWRFFDIYTSSGRRAERFIHQRRIDGDAEWLFLANGVNPFCHDVDEAPSYRFELTGEYKLTEYDTMSGNIHPMAVNYEGGKTIFERKMYLHDSLLFRLEPGRSAEKPCQIAQPPKETPSIILKPVEVQLNEPNMLLMDMAEYSVDGAAWQPLEEILRIDNIVRKSLNIPPRRKEVLQPYLIEPETPNHFLRLRFSVPSDIEIPAAYLGLEDVEHTQIIWNAERIIPEVKGWFVDRSIQKISLPGIHKGQNLLEIRVPIGRRTNLEAFYLLGDFGVRIKGVEKRIVAPVRKLGFGDVVHQGFPFYTGNVDYSFDVQVVNRLRIRVPQYRGALIQVFVDGMSAGTVIFSPYSLEIPEITPGHHRITLRLFGTRQNGFGQLHHTPSVYFYQSPNSWRSDGDLWCYEYQLRPIGILKSPEIYT